MALFAVSSLWPARPDLPLARLILALIGAPLITAAIISAVAFLIAGMSEQTSAGVIQVTVEAAIALSALVYGFTLSFGLVGIAILWALSLRGRLAWSLMGAGLGAFAGAVFSGIAMQGFHSTVMIAFAIAGWAVFMLIRWIARIGARGEQTSAPAKTEPS